MGTDFAYQIESPIVTEAQIALLVAENECLIQIVNDHFQAELGDLKVIEEFVDLVRPIEGCIACNNLTEELEERRGDDVAELGLHHVEIVVDSALLVEYEELTIGHEQLVEDAERNNRTGALDSRDAHHDRVNAQNLELVILQQLSQVIELLPIFYVQPGYDVPQDDDVNAYPHQEGFPFDL